MFKKLREKLRSSLSIFSKKAKEEAEEIPVEEVKEEIKEKEVVEEKKEEIIEEVP